MTSRLDENSSREELYKTTFHIQRLEELRIISEESKRRCLEELFKGFPCSDLIVNTLSSQKSKGVTKVVRAIGETAYWTKDPEAVRKVAEALGDEIVLETLKAYQGLEVVEVAKAIGETAYSTKDSEAVRKVAKKYLSRLIEK